MKNKIVFITGAANGIGFEIGQEFAKAGATVVLSDLNTGQLDQAVASLQAKKLFVSGITCDVTSEQQIKAALDETVRLHGRIDILINNAGLQYVSAIEDFPVDKFELLIKVMLVAPFITTKYVFPIMKQQQFGRITRKISIEKVLEEVIFPLVPQKRLLTVAEIAHYALFLAGDAARGITGQAILIDGGYTVQ